MNRNFIWKFCRKVCNFKWKYFSLLLFNKTPASEETNKQTNYYEKKLNSYD